MKHIASSEKNQAILIHKNARLLSCELIRDFPWELQKIAIKIRCHYIFLKVAGL
jgi:hypothetical protein